MRHAIIRLIEEHRMLSDVYRQIIGDVELAADPASRDMLARQTLQEMREVKGALVVLGRHIPIPTRPKVTKAAPTRPVFAWDMPEVRA